MSELKLCPFCGGEAEVTFEVDGTCAVECVSCGALVDGIEAWNTRADDAENAKLRELVADMWHELNYTSVRAEDGNNGCLKTMAGFDGRMHELGIEVDR